MENRSQVEIEKFYDGYNALDKQNRVFIRHYSILQFAKRFGLKADDTVLEIGCGTGTATALIAKHVSRGTVLAVDISPNSIALARQYLKPYKNVELLVSDMQDFSYPTPFDFVILPDVLEHIPIEQHAALFEKLGQYTTNQATVLIHIPHPRMLDYARGTNPEDLQIIDQALYSHLIAENFAKGGFYIEQVISYSLHTAEPDYQSIVLKKRLALNRVTKLPKWKVSLEKLFLKLA